jgi:hypothetical protein
MKPADPSLIERRTALVVSAQRLVAEAGDDAGALVDPRLAVDVVTAVADDVAAEIADRTAQGIATVEELVHALIDAALSAYEPWSDALGLIHSALGRMAFEQWLQVVEPWLVAVEHAIRDAQARGLVSRDVDPRITAHVLRDTMDRATQVTLRYAHEEYRSTAERLMCAALRP